MLTYSAAFTALLSLGAGVPFGAIAGAGLGLLLGLEFGTRPHTGSVAHVSEGFAVLRGLVLGIAGAVAFGLRFGAIFGVLSAAWLLAAYLLRFSVASEYSRERPTFPVRLVVVRNQAVRVAGTGLAAFVAGLVIGWGWPAAAGLAVRYSIATWVAGSLIGSGAPRVEAWADGLPARRLGLFGTILILIGFALESVQYWATVLE
jgi:sterol desaturase/sphingolipid hydroxylase (fatty acid hydroxylase superfamily)